MQAKYLVADPRDADAIKQVSRAITAWDPMLSLRFSRGELLYNGIYTSYGLSIGDPTTLSFRERRQAVNRGDAIVMPPSVRVASQPAADFLWICYEGLTPAHLSGPAGLELGIEHFAFDGGPEDRSICGRRREVLPVTDLRHRVQYHFVEIQNPEPHTHADMVELYYVLSGEGEVRVGPTVDQLTAVPVRAGQILAVGPGLFHLASDGLGRCIWFLYSEISHRRRVKESLAK